MKREAAGLEEPSAATPPTRRTRLFTGGYTIETTLDPKLFDATGPPRPPSSARRATRITAVASVVPGDGAIDNLFGGLDFAATQFDFADQGLRQPGSAFKPFVYLAALRDRDRPPQRLRRHVGTARSPATATSPSRTTPATQLRRRASTSTQALARRSTSSSSHLGCQVGVQSRAAGGHRRRRPDRRHRGPGRRLPRRPRPRREPADHGRAPTPPSPPAASTPSPTASARSGDSRGKVVYQHENVPPAGRSEPAEAGDPQRRPATVVDRGHRAGPRPSAGRWRARPARRRTTSTPGSSGYVPQCRHRGVGRLRPGRPMTGGPRPVGHRRQLPGRHLRHGHAPGARGYGPRTDPDGRSRRPRPASAQAGAVLALASAPIRQSPGRHHARRPGRRPRRTAGGSADDGRRATRRGRGSRPSRRRRQRPVDTEARRARRTSRQKRPPAGSSPTHAGPRNSALSPEADLGPGSRGRRRIKELN